MRRRPRGPRYRIRGGVIQAASLAGVPIQPAVCVAWPVVRFRSWDRFLLPKPFSNALIRYGPQLHVPPNLDREERRE